MFVSDADCPTSQSTGDHKWVTLPLQLRSNQVILFQVGVQLWAKRWEYTAHGATVLNLDYISNVDASTHAIATYVTFQRGL